ncbi:MAG: 50S ribosomal protein L25 [Candidatus Paceibacterota bacterium]
MLTLNITKRDAKINLENLRATGQMPAVFYGPKEKNTSISVSQKDFIKLLEKAGETTLVILKGDGMEVETLIHDVDYDPITDVPRHADFYAIEKGKKVKINVPLEFTGIAPAVKDLGGTLVKVLYEIEVEAFPRDLPHKIEVDIASLTTLNSQILAKDLRLPNGVEVKSKPEEVVASIAVYKEEVVEAVPVDLATAVEVEKKGKEAKEGAEGEVVADAKEAPKK